MAVNNYSYKFIKSLMRYPCVEEVWLYGSRARGDSHNRSDIDLAILAPKASETDWHQLMEIIDQADTLLNVDCVKFDQLKDESKLKHNINNQKIVLFRRSDHYVDKGVWKDYFDNLGNALSRLEEVLYHEDIDRIEYMQDAAIQRFGFAIELFWKVLRKFLAYEKVDSTTPRDVLRKAFQYQLIDDENIWLAMLDDRNSTSHVYNAEDAHKVFLNIKNHYPIMAETYKKLRVKFYA